MTRRTAIEEVIRHAVEKTEAFRTPEDGSTYVAEGKEKRASAKKQKKKKPRKKVVIPTGDSFLATVAAAVQERK